MSRVLPRLAIAVIATAASWTGAAAQVAPGPTSCESLVFLKRGAAPGPAVMNTCAAAIQSRANALYVPFVVQRALKNSFGFGPSSVEPAGLAGMQASDAADRLSASDLQVAPTAGEPPASPNWNAWVDGRYLHSDYASSAGGLDGPTWTGMGGMDYKLNSKVTVGLLVSGERTRLDSSAANLNTDTIGVGPYMGIVLTDNIVFSSNLLGSWIDSEQSGGVLRFNTSRVQGSAGLTGYWYKDTVRFTPGLTLSLSKDWEEEDNNAVADRTITVGLLTPSMQIGNTLRLSDTTTVEPWAGAAFDWTFLSRTDTSGSGHTNDPSADVRLQAGLNFGFGTNAQLAITGEYAGLLLDDLNSYSVEANFAYQF